MKLSWSKRGPLIVFIISLLFGIYAYYPTLVNRYVVADDIRICSYWVPQYHDAELFKDDLLTDYSRYHEPWGFHIVYYLGSFLFDPIVLGTLVTIILYAFTGFYLYQFLTFLVSPFAGVFGLVTFFMTINYASNMAGGIPRSFAFPLLVMFLNYAVRKNDKWTAITIVLQALFHPMICLMCTMAYGLSLLEFSKAKKVSLSKARLKIFCVACFVVVGLIFAKYGLGSGEKFGDAVNMDYMKENTEYYRGVGRYQLVPPLALGHVLDSHIIQNSKIYKMLIHYSHHIPVSTVAVKARAIFYGFLFIYILLGMLRKIKIPPVLLWLFLATVVMFKVADVMVLKLYIPSKYFRHTVPILGLAVFVSVIACFVSLIKIRWLKISVQIGLIVWLIFPFQFNRSRYYIDETRNKPLYEYLATLPKDVVIAAEPRVADNIPLFSLRKVFINLETSNPVYKTYWETIRTRSFEFFNMYYSDNPLYMFAFCVKNNVDYIVVKKEHFTSSYLSKNKIYFHPIELWIKKITQERKNFVLTKIRKEDMLFEHDDYFVIHRDVLVKKHKGLQ